MLTMRADDSTITLPEHQLRAGSSEPAGLGRGPSSPHRRLHLRAALIAAAAGGSVLLARHLHMMSGWFGVAILALLGLAVPLSRHLSRRIILTGALFFGWFPLLYWQVLPLGSVGRVSLTLSVLTAGLAGWVSCSPAPKHRLRLLVPRFSLIDAYPVVVAVLAAFSFRRWIRVSDGRSALTLLMRGWDNSGHYDMVESIRLHGATMDVVKPPAGAGSWAFAGYPQGYHSIVAFLMETLGSTRPGLPQAELVGYAHGIAISMICVTTMLAAGVCAIPRLRRYPVLAGPLVALTTLPFVFDPAARAVQSGFANFVVAAALAGCAVLIASSMRSVTPVWLAALGGTLIAVAHSWALLLVLAVPAALTIAVPRRRLRYAASRRLRLVSATVLVVTLLAIAHAGQVLLLLHKGVSSILTIDGGIVAPDPVLVSMAAISSLVLCILAAVPRAGPMALRRTDDRRTAALAVVPIIATAAGALIAYQQIRVNGAVGYYFFKFVTGFELVCFPVLAVGVIALAHRLIPRWGPRGAAHLIAGPLSIAVGALLFAPGIISHYSPQPITGRDPFNATVSGGLLSALHVQDEHSDRIVVYLAVGAYAPKLDRNAETWYRVLTRTLTSRSSATGLEGLGLMSPSIEQAKVAVRTILAYDRAQLVVVPPEYLSALRDGVPGEAQQQRVISW
jgi:hypothetical protein